MGSRRLLHFNVTAHPTAVWTLHQLRDAIGFEDAYRYLIHDQDSLFAGGLDESIKSLGLRVLRSPPHSPMANAVCERLIGTIRRECLDWLIPLSESHLRSILKEWVTPYNGARTAHGVGPGCPGHTGEYLSWIQVLAPLCRSQILQNIHQRYGLFTSLLARCRTLHTGL
jgi:putative transposase